MGKKQKTKKQDAQTPASGSKRIRVETAAIIALVALVLGFLAEK